MLCLVTQLSPTLCDTMDCSLPGSFVHEDSPGKNTGLSCHAFLQGIFPIQGLNPGLLHCSGFFTVWATREAAAEVVMSLQLHILITQEILKNINVWDFYWMVGLRFNYPYLKVFQVAIIYSQNKEPSYVHIIGKVHIS